MEKTYTHVVMNYASQGSEILFRGSDGIALAQRKKTVVVFGEDPNKKSSRVFLNDEYASRYLQEVVPANDLKEHEQQIVDADGVVGMALQPILDIRDAEPLIQLPEGAMELPGGIRNFN